MAVVSEEYKMWGLDGNISIMLGMPPETDDGEQLLLKSYREGFF